VIKKLFEHIGRYFQMLGIVFAKPEKWKVFRIRVFDEIQIIGINSISIVAIMSVFIGAVIALQISSNIDNPLLPKYTVGYITRSTTILEFSPTIISLILAGKVGSNISSEIGTMRITEQIDALEIMGVNSLNYLVLPKIIAAVTFFPILVIISMALSLVGGWVALVGTGLGSTEDYIYGIRAFFRPFEVTYALVKTLFFAFTIVSIASYYGYYTRGGSLEVGRAATEAVVTNSITVLVLNLILTQLLLL
jgi:phospholipid/cholesterol/gamma-HCH transport system permease protein